MKRYRDRGPWARRGIQTRVVLLVGAGMLAALGILGGASWMGLGAITTGLASERQMLAAAAGQHLGIILQGDLQVLQSVSAAISTEPTGRALEGAQVALKEAYLRARLLDRVFLVGPTRTILAIEPELPAGQPLPSPSEKDLATAFNDGRPTVTTLVEGAGPPRVYLLVPLRNWRALVVAVAAGEIDPTSPRFSSVLEPLRVRQGLALDLVDANGVALASTDPTRRLSRIEGGAEIARRLQRAAEDVWITGAGSDVEVTAMARVWGAPWGVVLRQPEPSGFREARSLRRMIIWLGPLLLAASLLLAWGAARSVRRPLVALTDAAEQIARGDLERPVPLPPDKAEDEVGRLARWLERMRVALKASLDHVERANAELEQRVEQRTHELKGLYLKLQEREEWREELLRKVISAQEDERRRLARELHDETSQTLSALNMKIETALAAWPVEASRDRLIEARELAVRTLGELHRLIFDLRPSVLDDLGLVSAIRWYAERHLEPRGISVRCEFTGFEDRLAPELETALFRVVQEAITNIAKHSGAETVLVQGFGAPDRITFEIEDDGKGFDPASLPPPAARERGLGLLGMRERVELFGGTLDLESSPGQGTRIVVTAPVRQEVADAEDSRPHRG